MQHKNNDFAQIAERYSAISQHYDDWFSTPWPAPAIRQGEALHNIMLSQGLPAKSRVLDLTCGVGTQAYGLALKGHAVTAVDISPGQIEEARRKAIAPDDRRLEIDWRVGNAAEIAEVAEGPFDLVISFGNSFPLLGTDAAIEACLAQSYDLLSPGGMLLISMRDHADLRARRPYLTGSGVLDNGARQGVWLETAEWLPGGRHYLSHVIFILTAPVREEHHYPFPALAALTKDETLSLLSGAGFAETAFWPQEENPAFSFPVFKGVKPA